MLMTMIVKLIDRPGPLLTHASRDGNTKHPQHRHELSKTYKTGYLIKKTRFPILLKSEKTINLYLN